MTKEDEKSDLCESIKIEIYTAFIEGFTVKYLSSIYKLNQYEIEGIIRDLCKKNNARN